MRKLLYLIIIFSASSLIGASCSRSSAPLATNKVTDTKVAYSMAEVSTANSRDKCWTVIGGQVYDITPYIGSHPGGEQKVLKLCGKDGAQAFQNQHGGQNKPKNILDGFKIGVLK